MIINKQKFLAELGRLLTFMYDEDRQTTLAMYGRMFDETANEEALLELLVSPTRQAVVLARSYDAKARKLQMEAQGDKAEYIDPDNAPAFIFTIDKIAQQAAELGVKEAPVSEDQFSIFDELPELDAEPAVSEVETEAESIPVEPAEPVEEATVEETVSETAEIAAPAQETEEAADEAEEHSDVDETADAVDAFLANFTIENGELVSVKTEDEAEPEKIEESGAAEEETAEVEEAKADALPEVEAVQAPVKTKRQTNILLLILYIFIAIPVSIVGVAILLIPTVFFLGLAAGCAYVGVSTIGMCLGSFAVIADTLAVFGFGLALVAAALLFVWLFIWFLGGAIVGFIKGVCILGRKICCKEVAVQ